MQTILGIESTCDETAAAVVRSGRETLSSVTSRQIDIHRTYGGVVPELASRRHLELVLPVIEEALEKAGLTLDEIDAIAVAKGPGLLGALLIGLNTAKALSLATGKPLIGVSHTEAHLYAAFMDKEPLFPALGMILSGGHTTIVHMKSQSEWSTLGETLDDAIGEAFDKVARLIDLPYPGGPPIEALAKEGDPLACPFKPALLADKPYAFSYSGLKTSVLHYLKKNPNASYANVAAGFQKAAFESVRTVLKRAIDALQPKALIFGGGVTANLALRSYIPSDLPQFWPSFELSLDNAAMIAGLGFHKLQESPEGDALSLTASTRLPI